MPGWSPTSFFILPLCLQSLLRTKGKKQLTSVSLFVCQECAKHFIFFIAFNPPKNPLKEVLLISTLFCRWETIGRLTFLAWGHKYPETVDCSSSLVRFYHFALPLPIGSISVSVAFIVFFILSWKRPLYTCKPTRVT